MTTCRKRKGEKRERVREERRIARSVPTAAAASSIQIAVLCPDSVILPVPSIGPLLRPSSPCRYVGANINYETCKNKEHSFIYERSESQCILLEVSNLDKFRSFLTIVISAVRSVVLADDFCSRIYKFLVVLPSNKRTVIDTFSCAFDELSSFGHKG